MTLKLCRRRQVYLRFKTPQGLRGFPFDLSVALTGPVDSESGMVLNLVELDQWLKKVSEDLQKQCLSLTWQGTLTVFQIFAMLMAAEATLERPAVGVLRWEIKEFQGLRYISEKRKIYREDEQFVSLPEGPGNQVPVLLKVYSIIEPLGASEPQGLRLQFLDNNEVFEHGLCF